MVVLAFDLDSLEVALGLSPRSARSSGHPARQWSAGAPALRSFAPLVSSNRPLPQPPGLTSSVQVLPANRPERDDAEPIVTDLKSKFELSELQIDRGYLNAEVVVELHNKGVDVISKPPAQPNGDRSANVRFHAQDRWYRDMAAQLGTAEGRAKRRERTAVEHALGRVSGIQGNKVRFRGLEKNQFHLQAVAVVNNCYVLNALFADHQAA